MKKEGWIGVDLDGTLAIYDGWQGELHIGKPIPSMVERVKHWISLGYEVRIFTARVTNRKLNQNGSRHSVRTVRKTIQDWAEKVIGTRLKVTNIKDYDMIELWDDRAINVKFNTGIPSGYTRIEE